MPTRNPADKVISIYSYGCAMYRSMTTRDCCCPFPVGYVRPTTLPGDGGWRVEAPPRVKLGGSATGLCLRCPARAQIDHDPSEPAPAMNNYLTSATGVEKRKTRGMAYRRSRNGSPSRTPGFAPYWKPAESRGARRARFFFGPRTWRPLGRCGRSVETVVDGAKLGDSWDLGRSGQSNEALE